MKKRWIYQVILISCLSCFMSQHKLKAGSLEQGGTLGFSTVWNVDTIKIIDHVHVPEGSILIIDPGTVVEFQGHFKLSIDGTIIANGQPGDTILFTINNTSGFNNGSITDGAWRGIRFNESGNSSEGPDTSFLTYCRIEYTKAITDLTQALGAALSTSSYSRIRVENCVFEHHLSKAQAGGISAWASDLVIRNNLFLDCEGFNGGAISAVRGFPRIEGNEIRDNNARKGGGIFGNLSNMNVVDNVIINNHASQMGGGIYYQGTDGLVSSNIISSNSCSGSGGGVYFCQNSSALVSNNLISNNIAVNDGGGFYCLESSPNLIGNGIFSNKANSTGGGIYFESFGQVLMNNTLAYNEADQKGGGMYLDKSSPEFINTVISSNFTPGSSTIYLRDELSDPDFINCLLEQGVADIFVETGEYNGLIVDCLEGADPSFQSPPAGTGHLYQTELSDWQYQPNSPCINKGKYPDLPLSLPETDLAGSRRISHGRLDMGALEADIHRLEACGSIASSGEWIADTILLTCDVVIEDDVVLRIAPGTKVLSQHFYGIRVDGTIHAEGSEEEPVVFSVLDTTGYSDISVNDGGWKGILFDSELQGGTMHDNDSSIFRHCIIEHVKDISALQVHYYSRLNVEEVVFRNNTGTRSGGIYSTFSDFEVKDSEFEYNRKNDLTYLDGAGAVYITFGGGLVSGNRFLMNTGSAIRLQACNLITITDNLIAYSELYGILSESSQNARISQNRIFNNGLFGVSMLKGSYSLRNNVVCNNMTGIGFSDCDPSYSINNTIANNSIFGIIHNRPLSIINTVLSNSGNEDLRSNGEVTIRNSFFGDPDFISPSTGRGLSADGLTADWRLQPISMAIDSGINDYPGIQFPQWDIEGKQRIINGTTDIGAYESPVVLPVLSRHPQNKINCEGDTVYLHAESEEIAIYQWIKDDEVLPGEDSSVLVLDGLDFLDEGNYFCRIANAFGAVSSSQAYVLVKEKPKFLTTPADKWLAEGDNHTFSLTAAGSNARYQWTKDGAEIENEQSPSLNLNSLSYGDEGQYQCIISNACGSDTSKSASIFLAPQLCMVTVSESSGKNLVVWEKKTKAPLLAYNIYRESIASGIYDLLANVPAHELSLFVDTVADPTVQAYLYKITAIDTGNLESDIDLCPPHKTVHLIVSTNPELNTTQLQWDRYYGFGYNTYTIYKSSTGLNFNQVHSMSASLNSWTDPDPSSGDQFYRIAVEKPVPCFPSGSGKKSGSESFQQALSNMDDNKLKAGEHPPDSISLNGSSVDENNLPGSLVGRFLTHDPDSMDMHSYHLVSGEGSSDNDFFSITGNLLIAAESFDYEERPFYDIRVRSTDNSSMFIERSFRILVNDLEENDGNGGFHNPPSMITISNNMIFEENAFGDLIGRLGTIDPDTFDVHIYSLVEGTGSDDNAAFTIMGDLLLAAEKFDYETRSEYTVRIRTIDLARNTYEYIINIQILDLDESVGISTTAGKSIRIQPNPFTERILISLPPSGKNPYTVKVFDLMGRLVSSRYGINSPSVVMDLEGIRSGYYIIEVSGPSGYRGRILKK